MTNRKLKERKERKKKLKAKKRVVRRREALQKEKKKAKESERMAKKYEIRQSPFRKDLEVNNETLKTSDKKVEPSMTEQTEVDDPRKVEWIREKLEHNMKILEALEEEIKKEEKERKGLHDDLKDKGANTLREKMDLLGNEAQKKLAKKIENV
jgi:hypothetical protein